MTEEQTRTFVPARDSVAENFLGKHSIHGVRAHGGGVEVQHEAPLPEEVPQQIAILCREIPVNYHQRPLKEKEEKK